MDLDDLQPLRGSLIGFLGEQIQVKVCITLKTMILLKESPKTVKVRYIIVETRSSYNIIIE